MKKTFILLAIAAISFSACEDKPEETVQYPRDIPMVDFSIWNNPCFYYNGIDTYNDSAVISHYPIENLFTFRWKINDFQRNEALIINSQNDFLNYITIKEGESNPIVDLSQYSLIAVRVSTYYNLDKPIKQMTQITGSNYKLTFECNEVGGTCDVKERTWIQAFLVSKIPSNTNINFFLNVNKINLNATTRLFLID